MTKLLFLIFFLSTSFCELAGQSLADSTQLIEMLLRPKNDTSTFLYADRIDNYYIERFKDALSKSKICGYNPIKKRKQCIDLTTSERQAIVDQVEKFKKPYWNSNLFHNSQLISLDTLNHLLRDTTGQGRLFLQVHYGRKHSQFTNPIFFHDNKMFIIQFVTMYGNDGGEDALVIYKKQNDTWARWLYVKGGYY